MYFKIFSGLISSHNNITLKKLVDALQAMLISITTEYTNLIKASLLVLHLNVGLVVNRQNYYTRYSLTHFIF